MERKRHSPGFAVRAGALVLTGAAAISAACGGSKAGGPEGNGKTPAATACATGENTATGSYELCVGYDPTKVDVTLTVPTPEATATVGRPEILAFLDEFNTEIQGAYSSAQIPAELCDQETIIRVAQEAKSYRENLDLKTGDIEPYVVRIGYLAREMQKLADVTGSTNFKELESNLEMGLNDDIRIVSSVRDLSEESAQSFMDTWRRNFLNRDPAYYDASYCQIFSPK